MGQVSLFMNKCSLFAKQVLQEGSRIIWPTRRDVIISSIIVFVLSAIFSVFFFFIDQILVRLIQWILGVGSYE